MELGPRLDDPGPLSGHNEEAEGDLMVVSFNPMNWKVPCKPPRDHSAVGSVIGENVHLRRASGSVGMEGQQDASCSLLADVQIDWRKFEKFIRVGEEVGL